MKELAILLLAGALTGAQAPSTATVITGPTQSVTVGQARPELKCGKYQHVYHWPGLCGPADCNGSSCYATCPSPPPDRCVDDMHAVTEREWQELMARLARLEKWRDAVEIRLVCVQPLQNGAYEAHWSDGTKTTTGLPAGGPDQLWLAKQPRCRSGKKGAAKK